MITRWWNEKTDDGYLGNLFTNGTLKVSVSLTEILGRFNLSQRQELDVQSDLKLPSSTSSGQTSSPAGQVAAGATAGLVGLSTSNINKVLGNTT